MYQRRNSTVRGFIKQGGVVVDTTSILPSLHHGRVLRSQYQCMFLDGELAGNA